MLGLMQHVDRRCELRVSPLRLWEFEPPAERVENFSNRASDVTNVRGDFHLKQVVIRLPRFGGSRQSDQFFKLCRVVPCGVLLRHVVTVPLATVPV